MKLVIPKGMRTGRHHPIDRCNCDVQKTVGIFSSFKEADEFNARYEASLSPEERIEIVNELRDRHHPEAATQGLVRVCRIIERKRD